MNDERLNNRQHEIDKLRKQMEAEMAEWVQEHDAQEVSQARQESDAEHREYLTRIKNRAEEAKQQAQAADTSLFSDIASQLNSDD